MTELVLLSGSEAEPDPRSYQQDSGLNLTRLLGAEGDGQVAWRRMRAADTTATARRRARGEALGVCARQTKPPRISKQEASSAPRCV